MTSVGAIVCHQCNAVCRYCIRQQSNMQYFRYKVSNLLCRSNPIAPASLARTLHTPTARTPTSENQIPTKDTETDKQTEVKAVAEADKQTEAEADKQIEAEVKAEREAEVKAEGEADVQPEAEADR